MEVQISRMFGYAQVMAAQYKNTVRFFQHVLHQVILPEQLNTIVFIHILGINNFLKPYGRNRAAKVLSLTILNTIIDKNAD